MSIARLSACALCFCVSESLSFSESTFLTYSSLSPFWLCSSARATMTNDPVPHQLCSSSHYSIVPPFHSTVPLFHSTVPHSSESRLPSSVTQAIRRWLLLCCFVFTVELSFCSELLLLCMVRTVVAMHIDYGACDLIFSQSCGIYYYNSFNNIARLPGIYGFMAT